ncbi:SpoIIE family protein phosphatase [Streptomyces spongiae]|uniref:protein-serine/threonine phosphatase n=2 Tax=Streptomyces spongiae TaxID=565072 RepID=A0A5N8X9C2_9ACTN|nr:SpoIIE family protein phosphatase [Streptomyces spongiae]
MAHIRASAVGGELALAASTGLTRAFTRSWDYISEDGSVSPARCVQRDAFVYLPHIGAPELAYGRPPLPPTTAGLLPDAGMAAAPLPGPDGPLGALSIVVPLSRAPDPGCRAFLEEVAQWVGGRLRWRPRGPEGVTPGLLLGREADPVGGSPAQPPTPGPQNEPSTRPEAVEAGTWSWDLRTGELTFGGPVLETLGVDPVAVGGRIDRWTVLIHPDDQPWVLTEADRVIRTRGVLDVQYRVARMDGTYAWIRSRAHVTTDDDGEPVRLSGTTWDTTATHAALESVGRALLHMSDGFLSVASDGRIAFVNTAAERMLGSPRTLVGRPLWEVPVLREVPEAAERCRRAAAGSEPWSSEVPGPQDHQWYHLRLVPVPDGLTVYLTDITERRRREAERRAAEHAAAERAALMARLTRALAEAATAHDVVEAVAESVLPPFDATGLIVLELKEEHLNVVGSTGYSDSFVERIHGTSVASAATGEAMRSHTPEFIASVEDFLARHPQRPDLANAEGMQACAFLPLIVSGRPIGMSVISYDRPHHFDEDERTLLTALSGLVAQALERAGLYDAAIAHAHDLQHALLPRVLPSLPAVTAAARYLPSARGADVGGDWYDIIPLSADRVALVIGDVMGHGMPEAATMGRLRTAVRTLSELELPPEDILAHANDLVAELDEESFTTCIYGIYDPTTQMFTYTNAGHPPPVVALPHGTATFLPADPDPPLGVAAPPFAVHDVHLPGGSVLALYTDGLVEIPGHDIDEDMACLSRTLTTALYTAGTQTDGHEAEPDELCDMVTAAVLSSDRPAPDDAALLITRTRATAAEDIAVWDLPDEPTACAQARRLVRDQLEEWDLGELEMTTELIVSELVGNVVRHARGPIGLRMMRSHSLICEVSDGSITTPHIRHPAALDEGGRGLQLVAAMAQRWGTRYTTTGKSIWCEQQVRV